MEQVEMRESTALSDRYAAEEGWVYMTGMQALVRLPLQQRLHDARSGWNTAGYISGYRGSPMGRYDMELGAADQELKNANIVFRPGLNEDLAATAIWGSQHVGNFAGARVDGVFGIWYGKGPGVDRSTDALRHANLAGTSRRGGVICLAGDDHGAKSSTVANFSDPVFIAIGMPILYPSNTQELLDFGLLGIALSRYCGCWVAIKLVTDVVEGGGSVHIDPSLHQLHHPAIVDGGGAVDHGVHIRAIDMALPQEERLYARKLPAAIAYAQACGLNRITVDPPVATAGIVAAGKAWQDVLQALAHLEWDDAVLHRAGIRLLKVGMIWPLDPAVVLRMAVGLETLIVVEEKRPVLEDQIRHVLYRTARAPDIVGKCRGSALFHGAGEPPVFPMHGELDPTLVAGVLKRELGTLVSPHLESSGRASSLLPVFESAP